MSRKDEIGDYLFHRFVEGEPCEPPALIQAASSLNSLAGSTMSRRRFEWMAPTNKKEALLDSLNALITLLKCRTVDHATFDELLLALEEVYDRRVHTLSPCLDILIDKGYYRDPDVMRVRDDKPMDPADAERAWQCEYQGTRHKTLLQNIAVSFRPATAYGNSGAIIQSSGYGKSRTVDEMATLIPTIPMNIRAVEEEERQGAFPLADAVLIDMFEEMVKSQDPLQSLLLFFKLLFDNVFDIAKDFRRDTFTVDLHRCLKDRGRRAKLYTDLCAAMKQSSNQIDVAEVARAYKKLDALFPESNVRVKLIIYIDEAHTLASMRSKGASLYDHMLKATAELGLHRDIHVFFLFLSTASRFEILAAQATLSNSARFQKAGDRLVAPFTEMPFDCHPSLVKKSIPPGLRLEAIQKFSFAVRFGRPLFWAYFEAMIAGVKDETQAHTATIHMAQAKLMGVNSLSLLEGTGKLAILDTLLNLDYDPQRTHSHHLASMMVASHLRTVYSVPTSRAYMHTGYPSEPTLAEAALSCANELAEETTSGLLLPLFRDLDKNTAGAIHKGERGENVGKMILLLAYIAAVKKHFEPTNNAQFWGHGCSLIDFLEELTGEQFKDGVFGSMPDNLPSGVTLRQAFQNSWVRFTHFARGADDAAMSSSVAWIAFIRGMAMMGWHSQQVVDVCIPVLLDKNKPIEEANMTSTLVQFKLQGSPTNTSLDQLKFKFFPPPNTSRDACPNTPEGEEAYRSRPYISLVMELGLVVTPDAASIRSKVMDILDRGDSYVATTTSQKRHNTNLSVSYVHIPLPPALRSQRTARRVHPRYSLTYRGCSHKVYRCIPNTAEAHNTLKTLLMIPTVFNDRPQNRLIDPVLQMKPFWSIGSNCFSWVSEPYVNPKNQQTEDENHDVSIGTKTMDVDVDDYGTTGDAMDQDL